MRYVYERESRLIPRLRDKVREFIHPTHVNHVNHNAEDDDELSWREYIL